MLNNEGMLIFFLRESRVQRGPEKLERSPPWSDELCDAEKERKVCAWISNPDMLCLEGFLSDVHIIKPTYDWTRGILAKTNPPKSLSNKSKKEKWMKSDSSVSDAYPETDYVQKCLTYL